MLSIRERICPHQRLVRSRSVSPLARVLRARGMQGYPIRIIIPGHIGGRMVKWLEEITVTPGESDNFYHFHDNRVLPPGIDQERAKAEGAKMLTC